MGHLRQTPPGTESETLAIRGAHAHNLRDVDVDLNRGCWTAVTGVSGSGKSTLVFDTVVREGRRRYLQSANPRARRALGKLGAAQGTLAGLPVPLAVGADRLTRTERSTVGTLLGADDLLRLVFARDAAGGPFTRSDFSFNSSGACETCSGLGEVEGIDVGKLVVAPERSIRDGALGPTLANGYTVYSQVTVEVMDQICRAHGFTVDTPWNTLSSDQQQVILQGTTALKVPFGKHSLESRLKWEGITARPREEGHYRGLLPVMTETLRRSRNPNILRYASSHPCPACEGTRLGPVGRTARVGAHTLPSLQRLPLRVLVPTLADLTSPVLEAVRPDLVGRLSTAVELGLGHLALARKSTTLSDGELQRTRLASQLGLELGGLVVACDEPTLGLHPSAFPALERSLRRLVGLGNTVLTVEHQPAFVATADHWLELGPGAGSEGGRVVHDEPMPTAPLSVPYARRERPESGFVRLQDARLHNLNTDLTLQRARLNVVCGPSGAGKSSLVFGTLLPALNGEAGPFGALSGADGLAVLHLDARPLGRTPRSTPATYTGLFDVVRKRFAALPGAASASAYSHNNKQGRCPRCEGLGVLKVGLHLMRDVERTCPACGGGRYRPEVLGITWRGHSIASLLQLTIDEATATYGDDDGVGPMLRALQQLGLGYLTLGRSTTTLSRGEAQRVRLATLLGHERPQPTVVLLDEPDRGLHPTDLERLLAGLQGLVEAGHTVVAISHHPALWSAADHLVQLEDGVAQVLAEPPTPSAPQCSTSQRPTNPPPTSIQLRGVRTHNLKGVQVDLPHRALSVVCGVSGSGKSSLVLDTLAAEAERRFAETLPFQVRRFLRRRERPVLDEAHGLTPVIVLEQRAQFGATSTVATVSGLGALLRLLYAREGTLDGEPVELWAEHFSTQREAGRCPACEGRGTRRRCAPALLVTHPERSIREGALQGTRPGRFFSEVDGRHLCLLEAAGVPLDTPWEALTRAERELALHGSEAVQRVTWHFRRGKRTGEHALEEPWTGFLALVTAEAEKRRNRADAADWWAPFETVGCEVCEGTGLKAPARNVRWRERTLPERLALPLERWPAELEGGHPLEVRLREAVEALLRLSLGHLAPARRVETLSGGEQQRLRLAEVLHQGLVGITLVLDEPAAGLDEAGADGLIQVLRRASRQNTVVVTSHRESLLRAADHLIELGPGAGAEGGEVLAAGPAAEVLAGEGPTAVALRQPVAAPVALEPTWSLEVELPGGTRSLELPDTGVVGLAGPSGSGKTLALRALARCGRFRTVVADTDAAASTVGFALDWMKAVQRWFHQAHPELPTRMFSHHSPAGRCPTCRGRGVERVALDILADLQVPCASCGGRRYRPEVLEARREGRSIDQLLELPLGHTALEPLGLKGREDAVQLGLGHLTLGTSIATLSGGERQRLALLAAGRGRGRLVLLDAPDQGLHDVDVDRMVRYLRGLRDLVVVATHRPRLLAALPVITL